MANETNSIFKMAHERSPNFASGVATGVALAGPTGDGLFQMLFYRDAMRIANESFDRTDSVSESGRPQFELRERSGDLELLAYREDLATLSLTKDTLKQLHRILSVALEESGA